MPQIQTLQEWLFKQTPIVVLLLLSNYFIYNYFTKEIQEQKKYFASELIKKENKIDFLENQIDKLTLEILTLKK